MKEYWKDSFQWKKKISVLKFFEEGKPMGFKELLEKSGVIGKEINIRKIGKIREIINDCKKIGLVIEIEENVFQINPESSSFETFKKFLKRKRKEGEMRER